MIAVTKPYLPSLSLYTDYLSRIWESEQLTNNGELVQELEGKLKEFLGVKHLFFVSNGTIALQIAIKALDLSQEVITTPFSYIATTSSIIWENCKPIFADIDEKTLCLSPEQVEEKITDKTTAILATHVYGNACDIEGLNNLAKKYNLKIIYDAAHAFGVKYKEKSLMSYGDISTLSFHSTKLFHTVEGGAIITENDEIAHKISYMRNFGHNGPEEFWGLGINGKNSEFHAAMGLCNLPIVPDLIRRRKQISELYDSLLLNSSKIKRPLLRLNTEYNYAYYPIILDSEDSLLAVKQILNENEIYPRRYFYPSLADIDYVKSITDSSSLKVSHELSKRSLCLPLHYKLTDEEVKRISQIILSVS